MSSGKPDENHLFPMQAKRTADVGTDVFLRERYDFPRIPLVVSMTPMP